MWTELEDLKESNEFLNMLLDNINSAVLIADENLQIHQFNDSFLSLFDSAAESVLEASFGETAGCVNAITENKSCELVSPDIVLNKLDRAFPFERFDSFFSIICMTLDLHQGLLTYSCAGHPPPVLARSDGALEILDHRGPSIGFGCEDPIGQHTVQMQTGDKILLYTDGLLESRNTRKDLYGKSRFYDVLKKHRHEPIRKMVDAVYANVNEFRHQAKPDDDISILGVEYHGQK